MPGPRYPILVQVNTRVWLTSLSRWLGRPFGLDDIPEGELDRLTRHGTNWVWLLGVWQTGVAGQRVSRSNPQWRREFEETLPDLKEEDIGGSGFAITAYRVHERLGGDAALARLRERLRQRGLRLMLDFVPNHVALDHPWVTTHPDYFIHGSEADLTHASQNYTRIGGHILAHGRDPYFDGWPDTLQLDYSNAAVQQAMLGELTKIAGQCDGVRCDMAMLIQPDIFVRTWGRASAPFWPGAIGHVRERVPGFCFLAEVYWDREWQMQQEGFDYAYDKRLYDRLHQGAARPVREHLSAGLDYQDRLARFLENHDEPRAAATFPPGVHEAAAVITYLTPGLRFFHQGQREGYRKRISPHLIRGPEEVSDPAIEAFYGRLVETLLLPTVVGGRWQLLECVPAWEGNPTHDDFIAFLWRKDEARLLVAVNYAGQASQCFVRLPIAELGGATWRLEDRLSSTAYERDGEELRTRGMYLDVPAWRCHAFAMTERR